MLVRELGRCTAVNNDCLNAQEISVAVIVGCNMGQICPQGQPWINQHHSNHTNTHIHTDSASGSQITLTLLYLIEESKSSSKRKGRYDCVWEIERGMRSKEGEEAEKEDRHFNNSQTPASFRIESVPKLDPRVLHTCHIIRSSKFWAFFFFFISICKLMSLQKEKAHLYLSGPLTTAADMDFYWRSDLIISRAGAEGERVERLEKHCNESLHYNFFSIQVYSMSAPKGDSV